MLPPLTLDAPPLSLPQVGKNLAVQTLVSKFSKEALHTRVLPQAARCDEDRLPAHSLQPTPHRGLLAPRAYPFPHNSSFSARSIACCPQSAASKHSPPSAPSGASPPTPPSRRTSSATGLPWIFPQDPHDLLLAVPPALDVAQQRQEGPPSSLYPTRILSLHLTRFQGDRSSAEGRKGFRRACLGLVLPGR